MSLIDTHCHINFDAYDPDRAAVIQRAVEAGVTLFINPAVDLATSQAILNLTAQFDGLYAAVGIHPNSTANFDPQMIDSLTSMVAHPRVVAIGEIGLDYYWRESPHEKQFEALEAQLDLAARLELPVIIHNRDSSEDVMRILEGWAARLPEALREHPGVMHSFSGNQSIAERALAAGFYLGFTGPITYKNADTLRSIAAAVPLDRILVETDGPFLTPVPHRGKRNEPAYIPLIVDRLAALHQMSSADFGAQTTANARRLFNLP
ncbi:MAG: TatD family hydrolase [Anaerolineae bacterium]|nr:TatD family hydrolase [Anaerolineae bacterium]